MTGLSVVYFGVGSAFNLSNIFDKKTCNLFILKMTTCINYISKFKNIYLILFVFVIGCSSTTNPKLMAEGGQWKNAYDEVDFILSKNNKAETERMIELVKQYPEIINYGVTTFSIENLKLWSDKVGEIEYYKLSVERFCVIATTEQCKTSIKNIDSVEKTIKKKLIIPKDLYDQLSNKEQQSLSDKYKLDFYKSSDIGIVTDRQVRTINTPGSNAGAEIGGAVGTAAYINKVTPSNYSMKNDLSSTAVGALVGALLMNKNATTQYVTTHTIKLRNGDVKTFEDMANKPTGEGIGTCVRIPVVVAIDQSFCTMTMTEFRNKFSGEINN